jgi:hypothetical protein
MDIRLHLHDQSVRIFWGTELKPMTFDQPIANDDTLRCVFCSNETEPMLWWQWSNHLANHHNFTILGNTKAGN